MQEIESELQTKGYTQEVMNAVTTILKKCHSERATTYTVEHKCDAFQKKLQIYAK